MLKPNLQEYRCVCGKLLFKGIIYVSVVEIKCRRCAQVTSFGDLLDNKNPLSFFMLVDRQGIIKDMCPGAEASLGYKRQQLIGNSIMQVSPVIHDRIVTDESFVEKNTSRRYEISNNTFFIRDGGEIKTESYCIAPQEQDSSSGYYVFSKIRRQQY